MDGKGHEITVAENGRDARKAFQDYYHLVLLDLKLPDVNGITLLKEIKARHPDSEVIIMTGYSTVKSAVELIQLGIRLLEKHSIPDALKASLTIKPCTR